MRSSRQFPVNRWTIFLSHIVKIPIDRAEGKNDEYLYVDLVKGRFQLSTDRAVYSFDDKYINFVAAFKTLQTQKFHQKNILVLGGGLGSVVYILEKYHHIKAHFTLVEYDLNVIRLFNKYTKPRLKSDIKIVEADAEYFINNNDMTYDMIIVDLFIDLEIPKKFRNLEFLELCKNNLAKNGVLLMNWMTASPWQKARYNKFKTSTFDPVFPQNSFVKTRYNYVLVGTKAG